MPRSIDELRIKSLSEITVIANNASNPQQGEAAVILAGFYFNAIGPVNVRNTEYATQFAAIAAAKDVDKYSSQDYINLGTIFHQGNNIELTIKFLIKSLLVAVAKAEEELKLNGSLKHAIELLLQIFSRKGKENLEIARQILNGLDALAKKARKITYDDKVFVLDLRRQQDAQPQQCTGFDFIWCLHFTIASQELLKLLGICRDLDVPGAEALFKQEKMDIAAEKVGYPERHPSYYSQKEQAARKPTGHALVRRLRANEAVRTAMAAKTIEQSVAIATSGAVKSATLAAVTNASAKLQQAREGAERMKNRSIAVKPKADKAIRRRSSSNDSVGSGRSVAYSDNEESTTVAPTASQSLTPGRSTSPTPEQVDKLWAAMEKKHAEEMVRMRTEMSNLLAQQFMVSAGIAPEAQLPAGLQEQIYRALQLSAMANDKAHATEQRTLQAISQILREQNAVVTDIKSIKEQISEHKKYLVMVIDRVNELGEGFALLSAKFEATQNDKQAIEDALRNQGYLEAADFLRCFVGLFEKEAQMHNIVDTGRFAFDYGRNGLILDALVAVAGIFPVPGLGTGAGFVRAAITAYNASTIKANAKKFMKCNGTVSEAHKFATKIAIAILKYNGPLLSGCSKQQIETLVIACNKIVLNFILKDKSGKPIYAEDVAKAILSGKGLEEFDLFTQVTLQAFENDKLMESRYKPGTTIANDWLSDVLKSYGEELVASTRPEPLPSPSADAAAGAPSSSNFGRTGYDIARSRDSAFGVFGVKTAANGTSSSNRTSVTRNVVS